ncbi:MAG: tetratricopeptide repeat protein [Anaerolineae bacterium]|nr:tetratricopeptide repeat protein [Anaerolineae bacterium]
MDSVAARDQMVENVAFFQQASAIAASYRLSFVQQESHHRQALEQELPNLWQAARQSYEQQAWEQIMAFRDALQPFLDLRGHWIQSLRLNEWAIEAAQAVGDQLSVARWTHDRADILHQQGDYTEAEKLYRASEEAYRALGKKDLALQSRHMRSLVVRAEGRLAEANSLCESTIGGARALGLDRWLAHPLYVRGLLAWDNGDFRQARQAVEKGLSLLVDTEEVAMIAQCRHFLGELALLQGNLAEARFQLENSLQLSERAGILRRVAATQRLLGDLERLEGNHEKAGKLYHKALETATHVGDRPQKARLLISQAQLMAGLGQTQPAVDLMIGAISTYEEIGDARGFITGSLLLVQLYLQQRKLGQALKMALAALKKARSSGLLRPRLLRNLLRRRSRL